MGGSYRHMDAYMMQQSELAHSPYYWGKTKSHALPAPAPAPAPTAPADPPVPPAPLNCS